MVRTALSMDQWLATEHKKYCPFDSCQANCPFMVEDCSLKQTLRENHKTMIQYFNNMSIYNRSGI